MSAPLYQHFTRSEPTLAWEAAPIVGADRERAAYRAHFWRVALAGLAAFWAGVACVIAWAVWS